ncbi:MAG: cyclic nucleotide-binding domain-containing protein [bacterium]
MAKQKISRVRKKFLPGQTIVKEGEISGWAFLILNGRVRITKKVHGHDQVLCELGANDLVGEISVIDRKPRTATVTAIVETDALMLNLTNLPEVMREHPETAIVVFRSMANKLRLANEKLTRGFSPEEVGFWQRLLKVTKLWFDATASQPSERKLENLKKILHEVFAIADEEAQALINRMIAAQILSDPSDSKGLIVQPERLDQFLEAYDLLHAEQESEQKLTLSDLSVSRHILGVVERTFGAVAQSHVIMNTPELQEAVLSTDLWLNYPENQREQYWEDCVQRLTKHGLLGWRFDKRAEVIVLIKKMQNVLTLGLEPGGQFDQTCGVLTGKRQ